LKTYDQLVRHSGNAALFRAIELSLVSTGRGTPLHLHAEGLRGTGKTTILRSARSVLPRIARIKGCTYNCDPANPHCPTHRGLSPEAIAALGVETIPIPFCEISHSAKVGTIAGSIDLARITDRQNPLAALLPGTIPRAHRGIILVDEINRLADTSPELADILLDVMGTKPGRIQIEETGLPTVEMPVIASIWAASNPDEDPGPLENIRRQLSDRFDLVINMARPTRSTVVRDILTPGEPATVAAGTAAAAAPAAGEAEAGPPATIEGTRQRLEGRIAAPAAALPEAVKQVIADLYVNFGLESLRAVEALGLAACTVAVMDDRREATQGDVISVAPMVLQHRVDLSTLSQTLEYLEEHGAGRDARMASAAVAAGQLNPKNTTGQGLTADGKGGNAQEAPPSGPNPEAVRKDSGNPETASPNPSNDRLTFDDGRPETQWQRLFAKLRERLGMTAEAGGSRPDDQSRPRAARPAKATPGGGTPAQGGRSPMTPGQAAANGQDGQNQSSPEANSQAAGGAVSPPANAQPVASAVPAKPLVELGERDIIACDDRWRKGERWL
jgi:magnesium chelatase subunit I